MEPWICPKCGAGVAPGVERCDHGQMGLNELQMLRSYLPANTYPPSAPVPFQCDSCKRGGVCMCILSGPSVTYAAN